MAVEDDGAGFDAGVGMTSNQALLESINATIRMEMDSLYNRLNAVIFAIY